jgi:hypothetical protein
MGWRDGVVRADGHRWRVLGQLAMARSMPFLCVQDDGRGTGQRLDRKRHTLMTGRKHLVV